MGRRTDIDWDPIKRDYEANLLTGDELATLHGVDRASIYRRAKKEGWTKNLAAQVQARTEARLVTATAATGKQQSNTNATPDPQKPATGKPSRAKANATGQPAQSTEDEAIEVAAQANVAVILGHRTDISRARKLTARLLDEAETQAEDVSKVLPMLAGAVDVVVGGKALPASDIVRIQAALHRAKELPTRVATLKGLTEAMRLQQGLERQAFGIDKSDGGGDDEQTDFRQRLINARDRARDRTVPASR